MSISEKTPMPKPTAPIVMKKPERRYRDCEVCGNKKMAFTVFGIVFSIGFLGSGSKVCTE